jgi:hypothetical protein
MAKLVQKKADLPQSILNYEKEVGKSAALQDRMPFARAWYGFQTPDSQWHFGPSKFIGYDGMTAGKYLSGSKKIDGRKTEARLNEWCREVHPKSKEHDDLADRLSTLLAKFGKVPSKAFRIAVIEDQTQGTVVGTLDDDLLELVVRLSQRMPDTWVQSLRAKLP